MRFEIIERHIIDVPDSELTDGERPLGKMALVEVLDVIAENPRSCLLYTSPSPRDCS